MRHAFSYIHQAWTWRHTTDLVPLLGLFLVGSTVVGARSFALDRVAVNARVDPDGSLWIDETRTYTYDGRYSWAEFGLPPGRVGSLSDFSLFEGDREFAASTSDAAGNYQLTSSRDEFYVRWHYAAENETRSFTLHRGWWSGRWWARRRHRVTPSKQRDRCGSQLAASLGIIDEY